MQKQPLFWIILAGVMLGGAYLLYRAIQPGSSRTISVMEWIRHPEAHADWAARAGTRCVPGAPFLLPTDGLIGYLWDDSFRPGHRHSGLDIFGGTAVGVTPVIAAASGYLSRDVDWKSALIMRLPSDPLEPSRQIWLYYTHMADPQGNSFISYEFPPGTAEEFVEAGTLLGYQGNYTGDAANPSGVHLHFSIVLSDERGKYKNELEIANTIDPSPYFGIPLNRNTAPDGVALCNAGE